jgi:hypothetical protein
MGPSEYRNRDKDIIYSCNAPRRDDDGGGRSEVRVWVVSRFGLKECGEEKIFSSSGVRTPNRLSLGESLFDYRDTTEH